MQQSKLILLCLVAFFCTVTAFSQSSKGGKSTGTNTKNANTDKQPGNNNQIPSKSIDSLKDEFMHLKASLGIKKKMGDTIAIYISNIDYDDANLAQLKQNLKTTKGVKNLVMNYKSGNATLEIIYKGKASDLWDSLPQEIRQFFKLQEAEDKSIVVEYKKT